MRALCHAILLSAWVYTAVYDWLYLPNFGRGSWFGKLLFITQINLAVQTLYFTISLVRSVHDWYKELGQGLGLPQGKIRRRRGQLPVYFDRTPLHQLVDTAYATAAFPCALITCTVFWCMLASGHQPVVLAQATVPKWYNQMLHTAPLFFMLVDTLLLCHRMPRRAFGSVVVLGQAALYVSALCVTRYNEGKWVYPILNKMKQEYAVGCLFAAVIAVWLFYIIVDSLNRLVWGVAAHCEERALSKQESLSVDDDQPAGDAAYHKKDK